MVISTIITAAAATTAARYATGKFTIYDAGKDLCDPGFTADAAAAKGVLAHWSTGLWVLEPQSPPSVSTVCAQQPTTSTLQLDDLFDFGSLLTPTVEQVRTISPI